MGLNHVTSQFIELSFTTWCSCSNKIPIFPCLALFLATVFGSVVARVGWFYSGFVSLVLSRASNCLRKSFAVVSLKAHLQQPNRNPPHVSCYYPAGNWQSDNTTLSIDHPGGGLTGTSWAHERTFICLKLPTSRAQFAFHACLLTMLQPCRALRISRNRERNLRALVITCHAYVATLTALRFKYYPCNVY